jgi:sugar/nucleoside kinase (ribokinase family)
MSLIVVGSVAFDALETPFGKTDKIPGGAAPYICLAASHFVDKVQLVSVIGGDFPLDYVEMLQERGVDTEGLQIKTDRHTMFWSGKYHSDMNSRDTITTELNVLADFDPIVPDSYQQAEYIMLGNLSPVVQRQVLERLHHRPKLIAMDTMNFWMTIAYEDLMTTISMVDLLCINDSEARELTNEHNLAKAAKKIQLMGPQYVVIKKGEHGALLFWKDKNFALPALLLEEVFDPTGAGDTFAGGFMGFLASTQDLSFQGMIHAMVKATVLASFCCEAFGTQRLEEVNQIMLEERTQKLYEQSQLAYLTLAQS